MLRNYIIIGGVAAALIGGAIYYRQQFNNFYNFNYKVTSIQVKSRSKELLKLRATLEIDNPSNLQFVLSSYSFDVFLNRTNRVGKISNPDVNQVLIRNGKSYVSFDIDIDLKNINWLSTGLDLLLAGKNSIITLRGNLVVKSGILFFRVPLDLSYTFKYLLS